MPKHVSILTLRQQGCIVSNRPPPTARHAHLDHALGQLNQSEKRLEAWQVLVITQPLDAEPTCCIRGSLPGPENQIRAMRMTGIKRQGISQACRSARIVKIKGLCELGNNILASSFACEGRTEQGAWQRQCPSRRRGQRILERIEHCFNCVFGALHSSNWRLCFSQLTGLPPCPTRAPWPLPARATADACQHLPTHWHTSMLSLRRNMVSLQAPVCSLNAGDIFILIIFHYMFALCNLV